MKAETKQELKNAIKGWAPVLQSGLNGHHARDIGGEGGAEPPLGEAQVSFESEEEERKRRLAKEKLAGADLMLHAFMCGAAVLLGFEGILRRLSSVTFDFQRVVPHYHATLCEPERFMLKHAPHTSAAFPLPWELRTKQHGKLRRYVEARVVTCPRCLVSLDAVKEQREEMVLAVFCWLGEVNHARLQPSLRAWGTLNPPVIDLSTYLRDNSLEMLLKKYPRQQWRPR